MPTLVAPLGVETNGTVGVWFVPAFTNYLVPTVAEMGASGVILLSCYITGDGLNTDVNENNVDDARLCTKQIFESPGDFSRTLELTYTFNPLAALQDKARLGLTRGRAGFIAIRWAVDAEAALAAGDLLDIYPVKMGAQRKLTPARNSVHKITQKPFVTGLMAEDVALAA